VDVTRKPSSDDGIGLIQTSDLFGRCIAARLRCIRPSRLMRFATRRKRQRNCYSSATHYCCGAVPQPVIAKRGITMLVCTS
jgi:hypothetical protein